MKAKYHSLWLFLFVCIPLLLTGCRRDGQENEILGEPHPDRTVIFTAELSDQALPSSGNTRMSIQEDSENKLNLHFRWKESDKITALFYQNGKIYQRTVTFRAIRDDGKSADFAVPIPQGINPDDRYRLYMIHGGAGLDDQQPMMVRFNMDSGKGRSSLDEMSNRNDIVFLYSSGNISGSKPDLGIIYFQPIGHVISACIKNTSKQPLPFSALGLKSASVEWLANTNPTEGSLFDISSRQLVSGKEFFGRECRFASAESVTILQPGESVTLWQWIYTLNKEVGDLTPVLYDASGNEMIQGNVMQKGTMYSGRRTRIHLAYNGEKLQTVNPSAIEITIAKNLQEGIELAISRINNEKDENVWIDLNNDGVRNDNETPILNNFHRYYPTSSTFTIYGRLASFRCNNGGITALDIRKQEGLNYIDCSKNELTDLNLDGISYPYNVHCGENKLKRIHFNPNAEKYVYHLTIFGNQFEELDLSHMTGLRMLDCSANRQLQKLTLADNISEMYRLNTAGTALSAASLMAIAHRLPAAVHTNQKYQWETMITLTDESNMTQEIADMAESKNWQVLISGARYSDYKTYVNPLEPWATHNVDELNTFATGDPIENPGKMYQYGRNHPISATDSAVQYLRKEDYWSLDDPQVWQYPNFICNAEKSCSWYNPTEEKSWKEIIEYQRKTGAPASYVGTNGGDPCPPGWRLPTGDEQAALIGISNIIFYSERYNDPAGFSCTFSDRIIREFSVNHLGMPFTPKSDNNYLIYRWGNGKNDKFYKLAYTYEYERDKNAISFTTAFYFEAIKYPNGHFAMKIMAKPVLNRNRVTDEITSDLFWKDNQWWLTPRQIQTRYLPHVGARWATRNSAGIFSGMGTLYGTEKLVPKQLHIEASTLGKVDEMYSVPHKIEACTLLWFSDMTMYNSEQTRFIRCIRNH